MTTSCGQDDHQVTETPRHGDARDVSAPDVVQGADVEPAKQVREQLATLPTTSSRCSGLRVGVDDAHLQQQAHDAHTVHDLAVQFPQVTSDAPEGLE